MSNETIYWTLSDGRSDKPIWKTNENGDVVITLGVPGTGQDEWPVNRDGTRMTIADMDACKNCKRCQANGQPLEASE